MINRIFISLLFMSLFFFGCEEQDSITTLSEEGLIEAMATDPAAAEVDYTALPATTRETIAADHFETFVETVIRVPGRGFIVNLANGETLYCRENGAFIQFRSEFRPGGVFDRHPHGRCFRRIRRFGERIRIADLPTTITDYIAENYADQVIRLAKVNGDSTLVGISGATVLLFGTGDEFLNEVDLLDHCTDRCGVVRPAVRLLIGQYVESNYPDVTIRRTCRRVNRIFLLGNNGGERIILIFDTEGNFLQERP